MSHQPEIEIKITALLLGELPPDEAADLQLTIERDPELAKLQARLQRTIELVRETSTVPTAQPAPAPMRMSEKRREALLQQFKTVRPKEFQKPEPRKTNWLMTGTVCAGLIALLAVIVTPNFVRSRSTSRQNAIINDLRLLDGAKQQWALENKKTGSDIPTYSNLAPYMGRGTGTLPEGSDGIKYIYNRVDQAPSIEGPEKLIKQLHGEKTSFFAASSNKRVQLSWDELAGEAPQAPVAATAVSRSAEVGTLSPAPPLPVVPAQKEYVANGGPAIVLPNEGDKTFTFNSAPFSNGAPSTPPVSTGQSALAGYGVSAGAGSLPEAEKDKNGFFANAQKNPSGEFPAQLPAKPLAQAPPAAVNGSLPVGDIPINYALASDISGTVNRLDGKKSENQSKSATLRGYYDDDVSTKSVTASDGIKLSYDLATDKLQKGEDTGLALGDQRNETSAGSQIRAQGGTAPGVATQLEAARAKAKADEELRQGYRFNSAERDAKETSPERVAKRKTHAVAVLRDRGASSLPLTPPPAEAAPNPDSSATATLHTRRFKVDPKAFVDELNKEVNSTPQAGGLVQTNATVASVSGIADQNRNGLNFVTRTNATRLNNEMLRTHLGLLGVDATKAGEMVFFNDRTGEILVRASDEDLEKAEAAIKMFAPAVRVEKPQEKKVKEDAPIPKVAEPAPVPQPEVQTLDNAFSTFSLNVSDVSFKLAAASLEKGVMPEAASIRSEEFINAFDYRDPEPPAGVPVAFASERARYPFAHNRDLLRFSIKTAALGRQQNRPLNIVLLLDNSGSMERADRQGIIREALKVLAAQLHPQDTLSVVAFARTARLVVDGVSGDQAGAVAEKVSGLTPQGGTNLEEAMRLAYETALRHYLANGINRVVLLTDGAANLGNVDAAALKQKVETNRQQGVALDCFGIGWEGYNDDLLEVLSRHGDGRYAFINTPEEASTEFAAKLAGALQVAAADVKAQIEFNTNRVTAYRQIGYAKHQLTKEQFRDNKVDAAEIGAAEAGNALYVIETKPNGTGPIATVRVRFKVPGTGEYQEHEWTVPCGGETAALEQAAPAMRLAASASAFSEWLAGSPYADEVTPDRLLGLLQRVPEFYGVDPRPKKLEWMIRQAKTISGK